MRIVNREEFLKLPSGTMYMIWEGSHVGTRGELLIKWDTICEGVDFIYQPLVDSDDESLEHNVKNMESLEAGEEVKSCFDSTTRDAGYGHGFKYIVYTLEEVRQLHALIGSLIDMRS